MKKLRFLFAAMAMVATISLASCSSDDDPTPESPGEPTHPIVDPIPIQPLPDTPEVTPY
nr:hypothetical protein [uncultured Carboxylicivirga sp.]